MILVAEDNEMMRNTLVKFLREKGYTVVSVPDGREAVRVYRARRKRITLVISDLKMPRLNGIQAYRKLKQINPQVKVLFASGLLDKGMQLRLKREGARYFLPKPYGPDEVLQKLAEVFGEEDEQTPN